MWRLLIPQILVIVLMMNACNSGEGDKETVPNREINAVMDDHVKELMAISGVVGVAVGALDNGTPYIMVLVVEETSTINKEVPSVLEGHPVRVVVSGEIRPMK